MTDTNSPADDPQSIANELISARTERGFSQAHLAELCGISRSAIKAYESGRNMPGSRELRALCNALKVTPNKLLFGTEAPAFGEDGAAGIEALLRSDPERQAIMRTRLALLSQKLTDDEAAALLLLVQSLVVARHGAEKARQTLLGADVLAGMARGMMKESATVIREGAQTVEPQRVAADLEDFLKRQGHAPKTDK